MKNILATLCILLILVAIAFWGDYLAHNFYAAEWLLAKAGLNWWIVPITARLLITFAFAKVVSVLVSPSGWGKVMWLVGAIVLLLFTEAIILTPFGKIYENAVFTPFFYEMPYRIIFYCVILILGFMLSTMKITWEVKEKKPVSFFLLLSMVIFAVMFMIRPMYIDDYEARQSEPLQASQLQAERISRDVDTTKQAYLFYFSTTCDHCYHMYHRLEACSDRLETGQIYMCLQGTDAQFIRFTHGRKVPFRYTMLPDSSFFIEAGPRLPACYFMKNGKNTNYLVGDQFNYRTLNYLCK